MASLFLNLATYVIPVFNTKKHNFVGNLTVCSSSVADPITDPGSNIKEEGKNRLGALSFLIFFIFLPCYKIVNYEKNFTPSEKDLSQLTMNWSIFSPKKLLQYSQKYGLDPGPE